jgi:hypothetical protein
MERPGRAVSHAEHEVIVLLLLLSGVVLAHRL